MDFQMKYCNTRSDDTALQPTHKCMWRSQIVDDDDDGAAAVVVVAPLSSTNQSMSVIVLKSYSQIKVRLGLPLHTHTERHTHVSIDRGVQVHLGDCFTYSSVLKLHTQKNSGMSESRNNCVQ